MKQKKGFQIFLLFIITFGLFFFQSCIDRLPIAKPMPEVNIDYQTLNKSIIVSAPLDANSYGIRKPYTLGKPLVLEVKNISENEYIIEIKDIEIFQESGNSWVKVENIGKNYWIDLSGTEANDVLFESLILKPRGEFPDDTQILDVMPKAYTRKPSWFRIYVFGHTADTIGSPDKVGAFVDVYLQP